MNPVNYVEICFYDPTHDNHGMINKIVSWIDGPFCHTELRWPPTSEAVSMYMGSKVIIRKRDFDESRYTILKLPCTVQQMTNAYLYAQKLRDEQVKFHLLALMPLPPMFSRERYSYCSKLIADILQHAGIIDLPCTNVSPSHLYRLLTEKKPHKISDAIDSRAIVLDFKV